MSNASVTISFSSSFCVKGSNTKPDTPALLCCYNYSFVSETPPVFVLTEALVYKTYASFST